MMRVGGRTDAADEGNTYTAEAKGLAGRHAGLGQQRRDDGNGVRDGGDDRLN